VHNNKTLKKAALGRLLKNSYINSTLKIRLALVKLTAFSSIFSPKRPIFECFSHQIERIPMQRFYTQSPVCSKEHWQAQGGSVTIFFKSKASIVEHFFEVINQG